MKKRKGLRKCSKPTPSSELAAILPETVLSRKSGRKSDKAETDFLQRLIEGDRANMNPHEAGLDLRKILETEINPPETVDDLDDNTVERYLRQMVEILARYHLCLFSTNHLTDRELYDYILERVVREPLGIGPNPIGTLIHHDCCPCEAEEWVSHYANEDERKEWEAIYGEPSPARAELPSNRDIWLQALAEAYRGQPLPEEEVGFRVSGRALRT
ncbi:MAG TPA: hypothetical protein VJ960_07505 [Oceanipulchritudo sp.]|nr:hypothetical protein [Oceanipulchritudo sp.]